MTVKWRPETNEMPDAMGFEVSKEVGKNFIISQNDGGHVAEIELSGRGVHELMSILSLEMTHDKQSALWNVVYDLLNQI